MKANFIPPDAIVAELEQKAADAEQKAAKEAEPQATELREEARAIENGPHPCGLGGGPVERSRA